MVKRASPVASSPVATTRDDNCSESALAGLSKFIGPPWTGAAGVS